MKVSRSGYYKWLKNKDRLNNYEINRRDLGKIIIDRLVHHSVIINIKGKSYRIKDIVQEDFEHQKSS